MPCSPPTHPFARAAQPSRRAANKPAPEPPQTAAQLRRDLRGKSPPDPPRHHPSRLHPRTAWVKTNKFWPRAVIPPEPPLTFPLRRRGPRARPQVLFTMHRLQRPEAAGLYDPNFEHDNCGVGAVACLTGDASHSTVERALDVLDALEHRGASGAEIDTGDGAGILLQTPHELPAAPSRTSSCRPRPVRRRHGLPPAGGRHPPGDRGLHRADHRRARPGAARLARRPGRTTTSRRERRRGRAARSARSSSAGPTTRQTSTRSSASSTSSAADREGARQRTSRSRASARRTIVYKGMLTRPQLREFFPDLADERIDERSSRSSTRASRRTRSRPGSSRTRTARSRTTARSTRCAAT